MRRIALIPSANEYADDLIPDLLGAEADGLRMGELLASKAGFEVIPVTGPLLTKRAFTRAVLDAVETLEAGDMFLLYAPMHATLRGEEQFLVCPEAELADIEDGHTDAAVSVRWLEARTARMGVRRVFLFDACRQSLRAAERLAGPVEATMEFSARNLVGSANPDAVHTAGTERPLTVFSACQKGYSAQEIPLIKRGLFSVAFEQAFLSRLERGLGVVLDDAFESEVSTMMRQLAQEYRLPGRQKPHLSEPIGLFPELVEPSVPPADATRAWPQGLAAVSEPSPLGGGVLLRLWEQARQRTADLARRKEAYKRLYPIYLELRSDPRTSAVELLEAWADLCQSCGVNVVPAKPGDLEWDEDGIRVVEVKRTKPEEGGHIAKIVLESFDSCWRSAEAGDPEAMKNLGWMYEYGKGVAQDAFDAVKWYRRSAEAGNHQGMCNLGWMYEYGKGVARDALDAVKWYRKSARAGNPFGMSNLGRMLENGESVAQDAAQAVKWYRESAEAGNPLGMKNLAWMLENGKGVALDAREAKKWYQKSAEVGYPFGMNILGLVFHDGRGVERAAVEAVKWYQKSAEAGDAYGMYNVGWMFERGCGVGLDSNEAAKWYRRAAARGHDGARKKVESLQR